MSIELSLSFQPGLPDGALTTYTQAARSTAMAEWFPSNTGQEITPAPGPPSPPKRVVHSHIEAEHECQMD